jgi:glycerophosphoryl diester phosphodiesterase
MAAGCVWLLAMLAAAGQPAIAGHRGTGSDRPWNPYPENSLPSIQKAFAEGAGLVEIDVQLDAREVPIVWHDEMVAIGGREVPARTVPRESMPLLVGPTGLAAEVPTFADALRLALQLGRCRRVLLVELKVHCPAERRLLAQRVVEVLREQRALDRVMVASTDAPILAHVEELAPGIETGFFAIGLTQGWRQVRRILGRQPTTIDWILVRQRFGVSRYSQTRLVRRAHRKGLKAGVWTVNRRINTWRFNRKGFDMIVTDDPDRIR